jgi:Putative phage metallopeptidase
MDTLNLLKDVDLKKSAVETSAVQELRTDDYLLLGDIVQEDFENLALDIKIKLFRWLKPKMKNGREILGQIKLCNELDKAIHGYDALIFVRWSWPTLTEKAQRIILFHELCHLDISEKGDLITVDHDIQDFYAVFRKFGDYSGEINHAGMKITEYQLELELPK